ncbi:MAG: right-handed parallel beta-helix repeat-containing protein [Bacteroidia bacterium]|nr:right-handed parallel beta-helix repeat-containing protein [Bacteroidia bacterium]
MRKLNGQARYLITSSLQKLSNQTSHGLREGTISTVLDPQGAQIPLTFRTRSQGSTYVLDLSNFLAPLFWQLDTWHEDKEPSRWCGDFFLEAEVADSLLGLAIGTERPAGAAQSDFSRFTSYLYSPSPTGVHAAMYSLQIRDTSTQNPLYPWVRARRANAACTATLTDPVAFPQGISTQLVTNTQWDWYPFLTGSGNPATIQVPKRDSLYELDMLLVNNCLHVDKLAFVRSPNDIFHAQPLLADAQASTLTACRGDTIQFSSAGSQTWQSCVDTLWEFGDGTRSFEANPTHVYPYADTFQVVLTLTEHCATAPGDTSYDTLYIRVIAPFVEAGPDTFTCDGNAVVLHALADPAFFWDTDSTLSNPLSLNPVVQPTQTTTYYLNAVDPLGCTNRDSVQVQVIDLNLRDTLLYLCPGSGPLALKLDQAFGLLWPPSPDLVFTPTSPYPQFTGQNSTVFTVLGWDACRCDTDTILVDIRIINHPIQTPDTTICPGTPLLLQADIQQGPVHWLPVIWISDPDTSAPTVAPKDSLTYFLQITDAAKKTCTDSVRVNVWPGPGVAKNPVWLCQGETATVSALGGTDFHWSPASMVQDSVAQSTGTVPIFGNTSVTLNYLDTLGCHYTEKVFLKIGDFCCEHPNSDWVLHDTTSTWLGALNGGSNLSGKTISIIGTLTVNGGANNWQNCRIFMAPDAKIVVPPGNSLVVQKSLVKACKEEMWDGIYLDTLTTLWANQNNGTWNGGIRDAKNGIVIHGNAIHTLTGNLFEHNLQSILVQKGTYSVQNSPFSGSIIAQNTFFTDPDSMLVPFAHNQGRIGVKMNQAIFSYPSNKLYLENNQFQGLDTAVAAFGVNQLEMQGNQFTKVDTGIYLDGLLLFNSYQDHFDRVETGVFADAIGFATLRECRVKDSRKGLIFQHNSALNVRDSDFSNLKYGIRVDRSLLNLDRSVFREIRFEYNSAGKVNAGSGIAVNSINKMAPLLPGEYKYVHIGTILSNPGNTFRQTDKAVSVSGSQEIWIRNNRFDSLSTYGIEIRSDSLGEISIERNQFRGIFQNPASKAISIYQSGFTPILIQQNNLYQVKNGILIENSPGKKVYIQENQIQNTSGLPRSLGIRVRDFTYPDSLIPGFDSTQYLIDTNHITLMGMGILASKARGLRARGNNVYLFLPNSPYDTSIGIRVDTCHRPILRKNHVFNQDFQSQGLSLKISGIHVNRCPSGVLTCNCVYNMGNSLVFEGDCNPTKTGNNWMHSGLNGIVLKQNAVIGTQGIPNRPSRNEWRGTTWNAHFYFFKSTLAIDYRFDQNAPLKQRPVPLLIKFSIPVFPNNQFPDNFDAPDNQWGCPEY